MRVKLTRRLGQNQAGTTLDTSDKQARWLMDRGYATSTEQPSRQAQSRESDEESKPKRQTKSKSSDGE